LVGIPVWTKAKETNTREELEHLHHLVKYYKGATQTIVYLKDEFNEVYNEFKKERHLLTESIVEF
jgi:hypothetical protein